METKNATIRLPLAVADYLNANGKSINQAIVDNVNALRMLRQSTMIELKGVLTQNEWMFLADSLNGTYVNDVYRCSKAALIAHIQDSDKYDNLGARWHVDVDSLTETISKLSGAHIDAIYTRIEDFWTKCPDSEEWSNY